VCSSCKGGKDLLAVGSCRRLRAAVLCHCGQESSGLGPKSRVPPPPTLRTLCSKRPILECGSLPRTTDGRAGFSLMLTKCPSLEARVGLWRQMWQKLVPHHRAWPPGTTARRLGLPYSMISAYSRKIAKPPAVVYLSLLKRSSHQALIPAPPRIVCWLLEAHRSVCPLFRLAALNSIYFRNALELRRQFFAFIHPSEVPNVSPETARAAKYPIAIFDAHPKA
jgi:hypothetical protein